MRTFFWNIWYYGVDSFLFVVDIDQHHPSEVLATVNTVVNIENDKMQQIIEIFDESQQDLKLQEKS